MRKLVLALVLALAHGGCGAAASPSPSPSPSPSLSPSGDSDPALAAVEVLELTAQPALLLRVRAPADQLEARMHEAMFALLAAAGRDLAGPPFARLVPDAPADGTITLDAGVPTIKPLAAPGGDIVVGELPAGPAATLLVVGPLTELPAAHATLQRWLAASGRAAAGPAGRCS